MRETKETLQLRFSNGSDASLAHSHILSCRQVTRSFQYGMRNFFLYGRFLPTSIPSSIHAKIKKKKKKLYRELEGDILLQLNTFFFLLRLSDNPDHVTPRNTPPFCLKVLHFEV